MADEKKIKYFFCRRCELYKTIRKCDMLKHLNKKNNCNPSLDLNGRNEESLIPICLDENKNIIEITKQTEFKCEKCLMKFTRKTSLTRHKINSCIKNIEDSIPNELLIEENNQLNDQLNGQSNNLKNELTTKFTTNITSNFITCCDEKKNIIDVKTNIILNNNFNFSFEKYNEPPEYLNGEKKVFLLVADEIFCKKIENIFNFTTINNKFEMKYNTLMEIIDPNLVDMRLLKKKNKHFFRKKEKQFINSKL